MKNIKKILLFLVIFGCTEGFTLRTLSWGGLGSSSLGLFGLIQLLPFILLFAYFIGINKLGFSFSKQLNTPIKLIFLLVFFIIFQSLFLIGINSDISVSEMFNNLIKIRFILYILIFKLIFFNSNLFDLINLILGISIICSIFIILQLIFGYESFGVIPILSDKKTRLFRLIISVPLLLPFAYFYFLNKFINYKKNLDLIFMLILFVSTVVQMHRNVIISISICTLLMLMFKKRFFLIALLSIILFYVFVNIGYDLFYFSSISLDDNNVSLRFDLILNTIQYVWDNYLIFGLGLVWDPTVLDLDQYYYSRFWLAPTYDSGLNNIILIFGIFGLAIYIMLFYRIFKSLSWSFKNSNDLRIKTLVNSLWYAFLYCILTSVASETFTIFYSAAIFYLLVYLVSHIETLVNKTIKIE